MPEPHTTQHGSPCAKTWTPDWIAVVEAQEESLGRPICGARLMSGNPCTLVSNHPSGRCRYHGGFDLTGAPDGNRNAVLHNLYSRRLMPCGPHCPVWKSCPLTFSLEKEKVSKEKPLRSQTGRQSIPSDPHSDRSHPYHPEGPLGKEKVSKKKPSAASGCTTNAPNQIGTTISPRDSAATASFGSTFSSPEEKVDGPQSRFIPTGYAQEIIALNPADRPICPYEQTEYNTAVTDALQSVPDRRGLAYARHIVHQLALAQVMVTRAGLALREAEFTKATVITGEKYHMTTPKVAPALAAYEKLERAWRRLLMHFDRSYVNYSDRPIEEELYRRRSHSDAPLDPDTQTRHYQSMIPLDPKKFYRDNQAKHAENDEATRPRSDTADDERTTDRQGDAPGEPNAYPRPNGSAGASPSHHITNPDPSGVESKEERNTVEDESRANSEILARAP